MIKNWFLQKTDSEQKIILGLSAFTVLMLLYAFLYIPVQRKNAQTESRIINAEHQISQMLVMEQELQQLQTGTQAADKISFTDTSNMMTAVEQTAKQLKIDDKHFTLKIQNKDSVAAIFNEVMFSTAIRWLDELQSRYQIKISQLNIEAVKPGIVNMSAVISSLPPL